jgi:hypothetical protein
MTAIPFATLKAKINSDCDLEDQDWVDNTDLLNYVNEAIADAEGEVHQLGIQDQYFRTRADLTLTLGQTAVALPTDIYAFKIGKIFIQKDNRWIQVRPFRNYQEYLDAITNGIQGEDMKFMLENDATAGPRLLLGPVPAANGVAKCTYIRRAKRVDGTGSATDILEIPEAENYIYALVKRYIAKKEGRPDYEIYAKDADDAYDMMVAKLKDIKVDEENLIPIDTSFYEDCTGVLGYPYEGGY